MTLLERMISLPNSKRKVLMFLSVKIVPVESMVSLSLTIIPIQFSMDHVLAGSSPRMPLNAGSMVMGRSRKSQYRIRLMCRTRRNRQVSISPEARLLQAVLQPIKTIKRANRHLLPQMTSTNLRFPVLTYSNSDPASMPNRRL